jgi:hypothetical protein
MTGWGQVLVLLAAFFSGGVLTTFVAKGLETRGDHQEGDGSGR